jgi:hypothetical protein
MDELSLQLMGVDSREGEICDEGNPVDVLGIQ